MKRLTAFIVTLLIAALLPWTAVQAAEQEHVILTAEKGRVKMEVRLPDASQGISTLKLRIKVEGNTEKLNENEPFTFKADEEISSRLLETRFQPKTGYFTIYISDTSKITDKAFFELGTITPNSVDDSEYDLTLSVPENGLEYVDGTGSLSEETAVVSSAVALKVNAPESTPDAGGEEKPEETPDTDPEEKPDTKPEETPDTDNGGASDTDTETDPEGDQSGASGDGTDQKPEGEPSDSEDGSKTASGSKDQNAQNGKTTDGEKRSAQTGDHSHLLLYLVLAGISAAGIGTVVVLRRK